MMTKRFQCSKYVDEIPLDDSECKYVNEYMEMPTEIFRQVCRSPKQMMKSHGLVTLWKVPPDYIYGRPYKLAKEVKNSSNKSQSSRSDYHYEDIGQTEEDRQKIKNVSQDILLTEDEEDDNNNDADSRTSGHESERMSVMDTLDMCYRKIPHLRQNLDDFSKHYKAGFMPPSNSGGGGSKLSGGEASFTGDTEPFEETSAGTAVVTSTVSSAATEKALLESYLDTLQANNPQLKTVEYQHVYKPTRKRKSSTNIDSKKESDILKKRPKLSLNSPTVIVSTPVPLSKILETNKTGQALKSKRLVNSGSPYAIRRTKRKSVNFNIKLTDGVKEDYIKSTSVELVPTLLRSTYASQKSLPFVKSESVEHIFKSTESTTQEVCVVTKSDKTLSKVMPNSRGATGVGSEKPLKLDKAVVTATGHSDSLLGVSNSIANCSSRTAASIAAAALPNGEELSIVQGLKTVQQIKIAAKKDFINRIKQMETKQFLVEADQQREKAETVNNSLDYVPLVLLAVEKYLYHNYSLDVKDESKKCHQRYLENTQLLNNVVYNVKKVYTHHMDRIQDRSSIQYQNLQLVQWFTVTTCMRLMAILEYRAFRSVDQYCDSLRRWLREQKILDSEDQVSRGMLSESGGVAGALLGHNSHGGGGRESAVSQSEAGSGYQQQRHQQQSPTSFSAGGGHNGGIPIAVVSPMKESHFPSRSGASSTAVASGSAVAAASSNSRQTTGAASTASTSSSSAFLVSNSTSTALATSVLTQEARTKLHKYCEINNIINNAYKNWLFAEKNRATFFHKGADYEEAWNQLNYRIIDRTGGIDITSIDESMPFVIIYLHGLTCCLHEYKSQLQSPESSAAAGPICSVPI